MVKSVALELNLQCEEIHYGQSFHALDKIGGLIVFETHKAQLECSCFWTVESVQHLNLFPDLVSRYPVSFDRFPANMKRLIAKFANVKSVMMSFDPTIDETGKHSA